MNERYPNLKQSFGIFGIYVAISLLIAMITFSASHHPAYMFVTMLAINVITIMIALKFKNAPLHYLIAEPRQFSVLFIPILIIVNLSFLIILDPIISLVPMPDILVEMFEKAIQKNIWGYVTAAVVAPITEELLFRKLILTGLLKNYNPKKAIIWSAVLFAVFHLNPWQGLSAFLIGIFLGWLYLHTRNIWLCIFVHWFNNSLAFATLIFTDDITFSIMDVIGSGWTLAGAMTLSAVCLYFCIRYLQSQFIKYPDTWNEDPEETAPLQP